MIIYQQTCVTFFLKSLFLSLSPQSAFSPSVTLQCSFQHHLLYAIISF